MPKIHNPKKHIPPKKIKEFITLTILGDFFEKIFESLGIDCKPVYSDVTTKKPLVKFINKLNIDENILLPQTGEIKFLLEFYSNLAKEIMDYAIANLFAEGDGSDA